MKRREFLKTSALAGAGLAFSPTVRAQSLAQPATGPAEGAGSLRAGFAREKITPPLGTTMMGFASRDMKQGCQGIHDDIDVRALFVQQGGERALIVAYDLCFLGREEADRFKGALGREFDLSPRQILLNTSHNHASPSVGTWYSAGYQAPDRLYVNELERATLKAARQASKGMREATMWAGLGETELPISRRKPDGKGGIAFEPNPGGTAYKRLPVCLLKDRTGKPVCLLFSVSAHPSMMSGWEISAEYPGAACRLLDEHLGATASMFLQGAGGDAKPSVIGKGLERFRPGTWEDVEAAGRIVAKETIAILDKRLNAVEPLVRSAIAETHWPLQPVPPRSEFEKMVKEMKPQEGPADIRRRWAMRQLELLDRGDDLPTAAAVTLQVLRLGRNLRMVGIEGEPVGQWGYLIEDFYGLALTFPLGYCNGQGLYLPVSKMIAEGGYEVVSYWEYGYPAPLAAGMEDVVLNELVKMARQGIA